MNILDFENALKEPDGYLEKGYRPNELYTLAFSRDYRDSETLAKLFCYAKAKVDPDFNIRIIKKRFKEHCDDYWSMMTVAAAMQGTSYYNTSSIEWAIRDAYDELNEAIRLKNRKVSDLKSLEDLYCRN